LLHVQQRGASTVANAIAVPVITGKSSINGRKSDGTRRAHSQVIDARSRDQSATRTGHQGD
jgi:hypothetical protein